MGLPVPPAPGFERLGEAQRIALARWASGQRPIPGMADRPHAAGHWLRWQEQAPAGREAGELAAAEAQLLSGEAAGNVGALPGMASGEKLGAGV